MSVLSLELEDESVQEIIKPEVKINSGSDQVYFYLPKRYKGYEFRILVLAKKAVKKKGDF